MSDLTDEDLRRIDEVGERFEAAWGRGERPRIGDHLDGPAGAFQVQLVRHLLRVELELRRDRGEEPAPEEYEAQMPAWAGCIREVFASEGGPREPAPTLLCLPSTAPGGGKGFGLPELHGLKILDELGRGAMGVVYKGWQVPLDRFVALKMIAPGGSGDRFRKEAKLIAQISSPHVVAVHDLHTLPDGGLLLVMEYVEGTDLARIMKTRGGPIPEDEALPWMRQVAEGMLAASERRIIHRDLKPSNILIDAKRRARVADFGLGQGPVEQGSLTRAGDVIGTPCYMAPEQAEDPQSVDTRADIYSFGATFYHALTGSPPFDGKTAFSILYKHKTEPLVSPVARNPEISGWVSDLLERCMAKSPGDRFPTFAELLAQLRPMAGAASSWEMADDPNWTRYLEAYKARRDSYLLGPPPHGECDRHEFPGGRILRVVRGTITEQRVDALVSSQSCDLAMDSGVGLALLRAAGDDVAREARRFGMVRPGRVVVTSAGRLAARFLFHGVTMGMLGDDWVLPSRDLIAEIMASCFYHADTLNVRSIAFPLLGTGVGGFSREVCLDTMYRYLARMFLHGLTCVQEARIVIFPLEW
ncbi:MAG: serine/threonine-protein kinase, partial [Planctomycetaceae bacterium]|nr:serine/threonine-protein kinase [Planctomycetaceae bacterium]